MNVRIVSLLAITFSLNSQIVAAELTGISADIGETMSDLQFETEQRAIRRDSISLRIEEKTATGLRVGVSIGQTSIRTTNLLPPADAEKFEGNYFGFYLRQPLRLGEHFSLQGQFSYQYNSANDSNTSLPSEIEWRETRVQLGLGVKFAALRITPFVAYRDISGDISNDTSTEIFDSINNRSRGISFDYFLESTAYIRLQLFTGEEDGGYLTFAREY